MMSTYGHAAAATRACLDAIERHDGRLKAFITVTADAAMAEAEAADRAAADGSWLGLLHGLPVAVKDNIDTAGVRTTHGCLHWADNVPNRDAEAVRRLRGAGAVLVGKATMHELAFGVRSDNPVIGQALNPWNPERVPGGSSGGSGSSVAAGMCVAALGSDTGGSVRLPASVNGVAGLRPTVGRISARGMSHVSPTHDTIGPMARRVADVARVFAVLAGHDPEDPRSEDRPLENFLPTLGDGIAGVRLGVPRNFYFERLDGDVEACVREAVEVLRRAGAQLVEVDVPEAEHAQDALRTITLADICHETRSFLSWDDSGRIGRQTWERMMGARELTAVDYARAMRFRETWRQTLAGVFRQCDILVSPTVPTRVPPIAEDRHLREATLETARNTYAGALGGLPGLSVPCGFTSDGLPVGLQLEAAWWREPLLLRAGCAYQAATDWHAKRPPLDG